MSGVRELDHVEFVPSEMSCFFLFLNQIAMQMTRFELTITALS